MKSIRCLIFATLVAVACIVVAHLTAHAQIGAVSMSPGRVVLRLHYRKVADERLSKPYTIGMFDSEVFSSIATFMGTDRDGCIYILDPQTSQSSILKRFDREGQFREAWHLIDAQAGKGVAVTKDGYVWTGLSRLDPESYAGFPIVVYRKGRKAPVLDWRQKLPKEVEDAIRKALKESGMEWEKGWMMVYGPEGGPSQVSLQFMGKAAIRDKQIVGFIWILVSSDGRRVLDVKMQTFDVRKGSIVRGTPHLAPDGRLWMNESDLSPQRSAWSKLWLWEKGKEKGEPLIDRTAIKEPWTGNFPFVASPPLVKIDAKGHIYLISPRGGQLPPWELALTVLDSQHRLVTYIPWMKYRVEMIYEWVKPLPDGSGFYRIQFFDKEAQVFFHPLPQ